MTEIATWPAEKLETGEKVDTNRWKSLFSDDTRKPAVSIQVVEGPLEAFSATPSSFEVGILLDDRLRLRQPLTVKISKENDSYIATFEKFEEFGYGDDPMGAVDDLRQAFAELYWTLKEEQTRLGSALNKLWDALQTVVEER